ncbi:MAG: hypothetical protein ACTHKL_05335, partial [Streptosporangiaceae bacterium]
HPVTPRRDYGTVTGLLVFGGPGAAAKAPQPVPGTVTAVDKSGNQSQEEAGDSGRFKMSLPAGTYQFAGRSPKVTLNGNPVGCGALNSVTVIPRQTTRNVEVICALE